jgi:hypothetical protein
VRILKGSNEASAELADKTQSMADNHGKIVWALEHATTPLALDAPTQKWTISLEGSRVSHYPPG